MRADKNEIFQHAGGEEITLVECLEMSIRLGSMRFKEWSTLSSRVWLPEGKREWFTRFDRVRGYFEPFESCRCVPCDSIHRTA